MKILKKCETSLMGGESSGDEDKSDHESEGEEDNDTDATVSFHNLNQENGIVEGEVDVHNDDSSISTTVDFDGVDFAPILADLELIRQNGRIRGPTGSYYSVASDFGFTEDEIRFNVINCHGSFLRQYFRGPWPNFQ